MNGFLSYCSCNLQKNIYKFSVVGSMVFIKKRQMMEVFRQSWRKVWNEWELRGMILLSLTAQIVLVILGNRRKYIATTWIRITVWSAYLLADYIAAMAGGILSNDIGDVYTDSGALDANYELKAFWAPLLLLHLGGTDAITAYSLEDNELWNRHSFAVFTQAMTTLYILLLSWTGSRLSLLFIVMFYVGLVKYCERVWVLYLASDKKFRDSIPDISTSASKIMEECRLKQLEGYHLTTNQVLEIEVPNHSVDTLLDELVPNAKELLMAYSLLEMVKRLIADLILSFQDRDASRAAFERDSMSWEKAFGVIEIELGLIYDLLYTKAKVVYSFWGIARRIIGISLTIIVLVVLTFYEMVSEKRHYAKIDIAITLVLLAVAPLLELYAFVELLLSDQTIHWLIVHKKTNILRAINGSLRFICAKKQRWSNFIGQFSLLSFALREKPLHFHGILMKLGIDEILEIHQYETPAPISNDLKEFIFNEFKRLRHWAKAHGHGLDLKALFGCRGGRTLKKYGFFDLEWSVQFEFDQIILVWHLATEILDHKDFESMFHERAKCLSQYMLYLLVKHPNMLPIGMAHIRFQEIYVEFGRFIEEQMSKSVRIHGKRDAIEMLQKVNSKVMLTTQGGDKSNFVIFHACKLASQINNRSYRWDMIASFWVEVLGHAAIQCRGRHHAQQLRGGGELLTHVWLLMAHFGLTDHFQIPRSRAIAGAVQR